MFDVEVGVAVERALDPWRITSYGPNPWLPSAAVSVMHHMAYFRDAIDTCRGTLSSCYRHPDINNRIPTASKTSLHMEGLACDIVPGSGFTIRQAVEAIWKRVVAKELGRVREVILEPHWVHVGWHRPGGSGPKLMQKTPAGYEMLML